ncbi:MAG: amidase family protein [Acidobacteriota bacterium]|nr:amidase family protein [Acidobacteriota bacterium]
MPGLARERHGPRRAPGGPPAGGRVGDPGRANRTSARGHSFRSERSSSGWSAVGGQTRNPHDPTRSPCGSSSGSAAAVAAGMVPLAVGTETDGSVVCPASVNGVVGIKPTVGLVSRRGIVPISHSQDTAGPMARTVEDAALLLEAMIGADPHDPVTALAEQARGWRLVRGAAPGSLVGRRIGVLRSATGYHDRVDRLFEQALEDLRAAGAEIVDGLGFEPPEGFAEASYEVLLYEFHHDLDAYLATLPDPRLAALTLEDLVAFNRKHAAEEMPWFGQEIFEKALARGELTEPTYIEASNLVRRATRREGIDGLIARHRLDALVAPTTAPAWKIDLVDGDHYLGGLSSYPAIAGYPHLTVPMGRVHGLPVGLSIIGGALSEPVLVDIARAYGSLRPVAEAAGEASP